MTQNLTFVVFRHKYLFQKKKRFSKKIGYQRHLEAIKSQPVPDGEIQKNMNVFSSCYYRARILITCKDKFFLFSYTAVCKISTSSQ